MLIQEELRKEPRNRTRSAQPDDDTENLCDSCWQGCVDKSSFPVTQCSWYIFSFKKMMQVAIKEK
jgi:hypothetical protein